MQIGFFTVFRRDPQHLLHATGLVASAHRAMPDVPVIQLTDLETPAVEGVADVRRLPHGPLLERRLEHYAACTNDDWLLVDTDVEIRGDVRAVFPPTPFDVALADRYWPAVGKLPAIPQAEDVLHTMPFNTGIVFCRNAQFWSDVLAVWRDYPPETRDWLSEQRAVYRVVRSGRYLVQILPGQLYNYPPRTADDPCTQALLVHYKGSRKGWWTDRILQSWQAVPEPLAVAS